MGLKDLLGDSYKDGMTIEDIEKVLSDRKLADLSSGDYVSKGKYAELDKKYKDIENKLKERMTAEEKQSEELAQREQYYKDLERKLNLSEFNNKLSSSISDEKTRNEIAELMVDGKISEAIEKQNIYYSNYKENLKKQIKEELLTNNPTPAPQVDKTKKWSDYTIDEKIKLSIENPTLYNQLKTQK